MIEIHKTEGYFEYINLLKNLPENADKIVFYVSSLNEDGVSWCPDCRIAEPVVQKVIDAVDESESSLQHFVWARVGAREIWKNPECYFRKDENIKLTSIPTLIRWKNISISEKYTAILKNEECANVLLLSQFFK